MRITARIRREAEFQITRVKKFIQDYKENGWLNLKEPYPRWANRFIKYCEKMRINDLKLNEQDEVVKKTLTDYIDELKKKIKFKA